MSGECVCGDPRCTCDDYEWRVGLVDADEAIREIQAQLDDDEHARDCSCDECREAHESERADLRNDEVMW